MISASSSLTKSESGGCPRRLARLLVARSILPFLTFFFGIVSLDISTDFRETHEVARGFRQPSDTARKHESPDPLDSNRDAVAAGVGAVLGSVAHAGCEEEADGDAELVDGNDGAADL